MNIEMPGAKLDLASAIAEGDIRVLLMVLVHMTGDERWLAPPYKPRRDVRLIPDPHAGYPGKSRTKFAPPSSNCSPMANPGRSYPILAMN